MRPTRMFELHRELTLQTASFRSIDTGGGLGMNGFLENRSRTFGGIEIHQTQNPLHKKGLDDFIEIE